MNEIELKWMEEVKPPQSDPAGSPIMSQLAKELKEVADEWERIGTVLEVPQWKLAAIAKEQHHRCMDCLINTLGYWQKNATLVNPFSWETAIQALKDIDNDVLAENLAKKYL